MGIWSYCKLSVSEDEAIYLIMAMELVNRRMVWAASG